MIELRDDKLRFAFPDIHPSARLTIDFQRTLRIPDTGEEYPLPPGLGSFPLRHVDDFADRVPPDWIEHGGVMLPMHSSEAMWLRFDAHQDAGREARYPFAVRIAAGKINAVTGQLWTRGLHPRPQDYVVVPKQPWLDGFCVDKGTIRQFVAMPLGQGYSAEEQITGEAAHGGVQIELFPMKREAFERLFPVKERHREIEMPRRQVCAKPAASYGSDMGLGAGGRMRQEIYDDPYDLADWDRERPLRCFVHLTHAARWKSITGDEPPTLPFTAADYSRRGLPWYDYYADAPAVAGSPILAGLESVAQLGEKKGEQPLPENEPVSGLRIVRLREGLKPEQVREGSF